MNLVKCANGHFFDADKFPSCPHCSAGAGDNNMTMPYTVPMDEDSVTMPLTEPIQPKQVVEPQIPPVSKSLEEALRNAKNSSIQDNEEKTISIYQQAHGEKKVEPTVGWLVCIEGNDFGRSYEIRTGRNFVGRGNDMDIVIKGDNGISRSRHAVILYEPKKRMFIAQAGESRELFYLNDDVVLSSAKLNARDILMLGNTRLMFIPLCGEEFGWDEYQKEEEE